MSVLYKDSDTQRFMERNQTYSYGIYCHEWYTEFSSTNLPFFTDFLIEMEWNITFMSYSEEKEDLHYFIYCLHVYVKIYMVPLWLKMLENYVIHCVLKKEKKIPGIILSEFYSSQKSTFAINVNCILQSKMYIKSAFFGDFSTSFYAWW